MKAEQLLPDHVNSGEFNGITVRKGTIGAFLINVKTLEKPETSAALREEVLAEMREAIPALYALGLIDVFEARDPAIRAMIEQYAPQHCASQY
jgi:hypothetical protein